MPGGFIRTTIIKKTRVERKCDTCETIIPKGDTCKRDIGRVESGDDFMCYYECKYCSGLVQKEPEYNIPPLKLVKDYSIPEEELPF